MHVIPIDSRSRRRPVRQKPKKSQTSRDPEHDAIIRSGAVTPTNYEERINRMLHGHLERLSNMRKARPAGKTA